MSLLSVVGLSEAFVMLRKYKELSEGQKYRYKLAKMIATDADVLLIDEFRTVSTGTTSRGSMSAFRCNSTSSSKRRMVTSVSAAG